MFTPRSVNGKACLIYSVKSYKKNFAINGCMLHNHISFISFIRRNSSLWVYWSSVIYHGCCYSVDLFYLPCHAEHSSILAILYLVLQIDRNFEFYQNDHPSSTAQLNLPMQFISRFRVVSLWFKKRVMFAHISDSLSAVLSLELAMCCKPLAAKHRVESKRCSWACFATFHVWILPLHPVNQLEIGENH